MSPGAQVLREEGLEIRGSYEGDRWPEERHKMNQQKVSDAEVSSGFDGALELAGHSGRWQRHLFLIVGLGNVIVACHTVGAVFLGATPDHWCEVDGTQNHNAFSNATFMNMTIPREADGFSSCLYYKKNYTSAIEKITKSITKQDISKANKKQLITDNNKVESMSKHKVTQLEDNNEYESSMSDIYFELVSSTYSTENCDKWHFDTSTFFSTTVTEYTLVCGRSWLRSSVQVVYMLGVLVGSLVMGDISDRFGRRLTSLICTVSMVILSFGCVIVPVFWGLLVLRFFLAIAGAGVMLVNFVLILEVVGPSHRTSYGMLYNMTFGLGVTVLAAFGYCIRDWRYLQLALSCCSALLLAYFKLLPESPRWLASKGRQNEALKILREIATVNGRALPLDHEMRMYIVKPKEVIKEGPKTLSTRCKDILETQLTLVRTPNMRRRCLICFFMWFVSATTYYGLTFSGGNIKADLFLMTAVGGLMEMLATTTAITFLNRFGRRKISCSFYVLGGISCLLILTVPRDFVYTNFALMNIGKYFISGVFSIGYMYSAELVPTSVRTVCVGTSSMCARIGSSMAPIIVDSLGGVHWVLPSTVFGVLALMAGALTLLLPETQNSPLPETIEEVEAADK